MKLHPTDALIHSADPDGYIHPDVRNFGTTIDDGLIYMEKGPERTTGRYRLTHDGERRRNAHRTRVHLLVRHTTLCGLRVPLPDDDMHVDMDVDRQLPALHYPCPGCQEKA